jgi:hypothetical protein
VQTLQHARLKRGVLVFRRKVPVALRPRIGRTEIVRALRAQSISQAKLRTRWLWLSTERLFTMLRANPGVTKEHIEQIIASLRGDCEYADEVRLATTGNLFDHTGDPPLDADAIVMETRADEFRHDLAHNRIEGVRDHAQERGAAGGLKIEPGSIDERLIGRAILKEYIRSCEQAAAQARERFTCLYPDLDAELGEVSVSASLAPSLTAKSFAVERNAGNPAGAPAGPIVVPPGLTAGKKFAPPAETLLELYDKFKNEKEADAQPDTWDQNRKIVKRFFEFIGETSHVSAITRKSVRD